MVSVAFGLVAGSAHATGVPTHDHFLNVPGNDSVVQVGPPVCDNPDLHDAFHNFHANVHTGSPKTEGGLVLFATLCS